MAAVDPPNPLPTGKTQMTFVPETMNVQTHSNALPLNPPVGTTYYAGDASGTNVLKCPEGYVFDGSNALFSGLEDKNVLKYNSANNWLNLDGTPITTNPWSSGSLTCKRKYCEALGIVDSDKEYDVIVDDDTNQSHTVTCNEGYVFDTTNHRTGKVKCGVIPEMSPDLSKETEVAWIADNPLLEAQCSSKSSEAECNSYNIEYIVSEDINQAYVAHSSGIKQLKCTWVPDINTNTPGNNSGLARTGTCKFIHRADLNKTSPICRSMYCSKKEVENSDRVDGMTGALPGPNEGSIHGDCINFDGQILDQITNSSDCACFKHKSCDRCAADNNCQWCGYSTTPGNEGEGGFCYSRNTPLSICNTSVRTDKGGTCVHAKTGENKPNTPTGGFSRDTCETNVCVKQSYWDTLTSNDTEDSNAISANYFTNRVTRDECEIDNNEWDATATTIAPDHCNLTNKKLDISRNYRYYPHNFTPNAPVKFKISDKICVPISDIFTPADLNTCGSYTTKSNCTGSCQWIDNPLRDSLFKWNRGSSDRNKIIFHVSGSSPPTASSDCPIIYSVDPPSASNLNNSSELIFEAEVTDGGEYITLGPRVTGALPPKYNATTTSSTTTSPSMDGTSDNYFTSCPIQKVERKIFNSSVCQNMSILPPASNHLSTPETCEGGTKYCSSSTVRKDNNAPACGTSPNAEPGVTIPSGGCPYYPNNPTVAPPGGTASQPADYGCWGDKVDPLCEPSDASLEKFNCKKDILPDASDTCENTGYTPVNAPGTTTSLNTINNNILDGKRFRNYITCDVKGSDNTVKETRCDNIGIDYAHWGSMCVSGSGATETKLPAKQICDLVSQYKENIVNSGGTAATGLDGGATWGKFKPPGGSTLEYGCFKDNGSKYTDTQLCEMAHVAATAGILTGPNITTTSNFTPSGANQCIIDATDNNKDYSSATSSSSTEVDLNTMCTSGQDHYVAFEFINNATQAVQTGQCKIAGNGPNRGNPTPNPQATCEINNKLWVPKHYNYNANNTCENTGTSRLINQPDIPTEWTGGEVVNDDGIHRSECSPSIMSSCNVNCNAGYGGGGEYICQYNSSGGDVCDLIDRKVVPNKQLLCDSQPACNYTNGHCVHDTNFENDGHLEWIGSPCYKIDNTAFAHGISKLPDLDVVFPPFERVVFHLIILMLIAAPSIYIFTHYLLKYLGISVDKSLNNSFKLLNKSVDFFTQENKLFDLLFDRNMTGGEKAGIFISAIGLFVGSYFLFDYIKEYVHDAFHTGSGMLGDLITKLGKVNIVVPPKNTDLGDHIGDQVNNAASHARDRIGFVFEGTGTNITEESAKLTMIVQVAVVSLVGIIIVMLFVKDPGDFRKKLEARAAN